MLTIISSDVSSADADADFSGEDEVDPREVFRRGVISGDNEISGSLGI